MPTYDELSNLTHEELSVFSHGELQDRSYDELMVLARERLTKFSDIHDDADIPVAVNVYIQNLYIQEATQIPEVPAPITGKWTKPLAQILFEKLLDVVTDPVKLVAIIECLRIVLKALGAD